jgi:ABC-type antimicrobial peptide transport system permease subunit
MVNEAFVRRYASSVNPIGRHFGLDDGKPPDIEIVGVIGDALFRDPQAAIEPIVFLPVVQTPNQFALDCEIELRTTGDTAGVVSAVRRLLAEIDPNLPVNDPELLSDQISRTFDSQRLAARFVGLFGLLALTLAAVGLYGTIGQNVARRTSEIGVRMALGAERGRVLWMILRQTLVLLGVGLALGVPAAVLASRLVASQLFGVRAIDPLSFVGGIVVLAAAATGAGLVPARRATRVNPVVALRAE